MPETIPTPIPEMTHLYRVENPNIAAQPDGVTSHEALVGQWFSPNLETATAYLRKSTQTFGKGAKPVDGAQLVIATVPSSEMDGMHMSNNPIARGMDVEDDNYIVPRDGSVFLETVPLDDVIGDLRGKLGNVENSLEAKRRIVLEVGSLSLYGKLITFP